jgi:hypothetical protein
MDETMREGVRLTCMCALIPFKNLGDSAALLACNTWVQCTQCNDDDNNVDSDDDDDDDDDGDGAVSSVQKWRKQNHRALQFTWDVAAKLSKIRASGPTTNAYACRKQRHTIHNTHHTHDTHHRHHAWGITCTQQQTWGRKRQLKYKLEEWCATRTAAAPINWNCYSFMPAEQRQRPVVVGANGRHPTNLNVKIKASKTAMPIIARASNSNSDALIVT